MILYRILCAIGLHLRKYERYEETKVHWGGDIGTVTEVVPWTYCKDCGKSLGYTRGHCITCDYPPKGYRWKNELELEKIDQ